MTDNYQKWHPGNLVADAAQRFTELVNTPRTLEPARALPRTEAQQIAVGILHRQACPAAPGFTHWIPPSMTECARQCGTRI